MQPPVSLIAVPTPVNVGDPSGAERDWGSGAILPEAGPLDVPSSGEQTSHLSRGLLDTIPQ